MAILKGYRKLTLAILGGVTVIITAMVGDITVSEMINALVKIVLGFFAANSVEHLSGLLGKKPE